MSSSIATATAPKRTSKGKRRGERNILTFYEKIAVIRYYDESNISRNSLAKMFHCCATQIRRILERKNELMQQLATLSEADASIIIEEMTRKRRKFEMCAISFILHQWVERCRQLRLCKSITNQTLKDTAIKMAAILNLPSFRPSYRWLNRFRGKYKYNEQDLGSTAECTVQGELSVEDIIIEFKDSLPSFMQKEISLITSSSRVDEVVQQNLLSDTTAAAKATTNDVPQINKLNILHENNTSSKDFEDLSGEDDDEAMLADDNNIGGDGDDDDGYGPSVNVTPNFLLSSDNGRVSAGTTALLNSVFPHLAVIHQFALLNSDIKALELISHLGVHMQTQAAEGAYKAMENGSSSGVGSMPYSNDTSAYAADIDDIVLIE